MTRGKKTCKILKEIRQQIADRNDIEYITSECHFQGECKGTCPKCKAELQYLENELSKRRQLGKAVAVAGISLGIAGSFAACNSQKHRNITTFEQKTTINIDTNSVIEGNILLGMIEIFPEYPGGDEARIRFFQENIVYPEEAKEQKIEGKVYIGFVVEIDGSLTNFEILRSIHPLLDEEALRVVKLMPKWKPGEQKGKVARISFQIPIRFELDDEK